MTRFVALLRGINVGGNNIIKMQDLKATFEEMGFTNVKTYIQSGNIAFDSKDEDIWQKIEDVLEAKLSYKLKIVLLTQDKIRELLTNIPSGFGNQTDEYKYDVLFLRPPLTAAMAMEHIAPRETIDQVTSGDGVLYFQRLTSASTKSYLNELIKNAIYKEMTVRNWNTTKKLGEL